nr:AAA family ATPase [Gemmatimonadaceae bacterium]
MRITKFQAENFKKLRVVEINPGDGAVVPIRGRNAQGKSSVLDAIQAALGGKSVMPSKPVRSGQDEGAIRLEIDGGELVVRRTFDTEGGGQIIVESADGARFPSPQKMLDGLYTSVAFDPLEFTRAKPGEQFSIIRSLVKLDVDPEKLEGLNLADFENRRDINRDAKTAAAQLQAMATHAALPAEPIDEAALEQEIAKAATSNGEIEVRRANRDNAIGRLEIMAIDIAAIETRLADLQEQLTQANSARDELKAKLDAADPLPDPVDVSEAQERLREARETNRKIAENKIRHAQELNVASLEKKADALTKQIETRNAEIAAAFERAEMPVAGLTLSEGGVFFGGEPFEQTSSAEQLRVSTAIGMAGNPKLRVMLVRDASLLDEEGEKLLATMAEEHGFQLWMETVGATGKVGIVMEDGAVATIDGEEAPAPAPIEKRRKVKDAPA